MNKYKVRQAALIISFPILALTKSFSDNSDYTSHQENTPAIQYQSDQSFNLKQYCTENFPEDFRLQCEKTYQKGLEAKIK